MKIVAATTVTGPYIIARYTAFSEYCSSHELALMEFGRYSHDYTWDLVDHSVPYQRIVLTEVSIENHSSMERKFLIQSALSQLRPDLLVICGYGVTGMLSALDWALHDNDKNVPIIMLSDSTEQDAPRVWWREEVKRRLVSLCSSALVAGRRHVDYLSALGMPRERIFTRYDVVDNPHFSVGADEARRNADHERTRLTLPPHFFLASNRFIEKKNLPRLLDAYARYRNQAGESAWKLVLLGDGPLKPQLQALIQQHNLSSWVLMPGFKQYDELPAYYGLAGAFIQASTTEQWGLVVNEAMAAGLPVLVSNRCGCAPDLVEEGRNGYTFDPYDVDALAGLMRKIAADDCDREVMGQASREIIARWTPQTFAENLCKAAEAAMNAPRPKANLLDKALLWALMRR